MQLGVSGSKGYAWSLRGLPGGGLSNAGPQRKRSLSAQTEGIGAREGPSPEEEANLRYVARPRFKKQNRKEGKREW
jgi:hypothetical protein